MKSWVPFAVRAMILGVFGGAVAAFTPPADAGACKNRGDLDAIYCDEDSDLLADAPKDSKALRNPDTITFSYLTGSGTAPDAPLRALGDHLAKCADKPVALIAVDSPGQAMEAMRGGRAQLAAFGVEHVPLAVNTAGAIPFAAKANDRGARGYRVAFVVRKDSPYQKLPDMKGRKVAHRSPSSLTGNGAARAFFPEEGLVPETDYTIAYSAEHNRSILGVISGAYEGAVVPTDVLDRMIARGTVRPDALRSLYLSPVFPSFTLAHSYDLEPRLARRIGECVIGFRFSPEMAKEMGAADRFVPIVYRRDWDYPLRAVKAAGLPINRGTETELFQDPQNPGAAPKRPAP